MKLMLSIILFSIPLLADDATTTKKIVTLKPKKVVQKSLFIPKKRNPTTNGTTCKDSTGEWKPGTPQYERCAIPAADAK